MKKFFKKIGDFFTKLFYPKKVSKKSSTKKALTDSAVEKNSMDKAISDARDAVEKLKSMKAPRNVTKNSGIKEVAKKLKKKTKSELRTEMLIAVKEENYELAAKLRDKINETI